MSDLLTRTDPVPTTPFSVGDLKISLAPPMMRHSLRARQGRLLESSLGIKLPREIGVTEGGVICLGPDEWLMRAAPGTTIATTAGLPVAVTDISDRAVCLVVEGAGAARMLMSGCPLDLDRLAVGRATRTIYETVEIILIREAEDRFHVEVWRSFAPWLWTALTTAASQ